MEFIDLFKEKALSIINAFSDSPEGCFFLSSILGIMSMLCLRSLAIALLEMHRSRSKMKRIYISYNFYQKLIMKPAWQECLHAKTFCRFLIVCHHFRLIFFLLSISFSLIANAYPALMPIAGYFSGSVFFVVDVPVLILHLVMDRHPFQRLKNEYRFKKYHNTENHDSLF